MARIVSATVVIALIGVFAGCRDPYSGRRVPFDTSRQTIPYAPPGAAETDLVEKVVVARQTYQQDLQYLVGYYTKTGNNMKLQWARRELDGLIKMSKYDYILGPTPGEQKAAEPIPTADTLFYSAQDLERSARLVPGIPDKEKLRLARQKYIQLTRDYPTSDKVDDAAFLIGVICEDLNDYMVALDYYTNAYKWDPETIYPARFKAAYILDKYQHRYADALTLYNEALKIEARFDRHRQWKDFAELRVREIQKLGEGQN